jgi:hypothetical protein
MMTPARPSSARLVLALCAVLLLASAAACSNGGIECDNAPCVDIGDAGAPPDVSPEDAGDGG